MENTEREVLIPLIPKTDFEKNLFLKYTVQKLKEEIKELKSGKAVRDANIEIGKLQAYISELEDKLIDNKLHIAKIKNQAQQITNLIEKQNSLKEQITKEGLSGTTFKKNLTNTIKCRDKQIAQLIERQKQLKDELTNTGFSDTVGKPIYEGDQLIWLDQDLHEGQRHDKEQVYWCDKKGAWMLDNSYQQDKSSGDFLYKELEDFRYKVVGNIYQSNDNARERIKTVVA